MKTAPEPGIHQHLGNSWPNVQEQGECIEIDTSQDREATYGLLREQLAEHTDPELMAQPLSEQAEILLGLRPYPRDE